MSNLGGEDFSPLFLYGRAHRESSNPYLPLREVLEEFAEKEEEREAVSVSCSMSFLGHEDQGSQKDTASLRDLMSSDKESENFFKNIAERLKEIAETSPLVIFLDDLQWADKGTLHLFHYLSDSLEDVPISFVGAYRPEEIEPEHGVEEIKRRLKRERYFHSLELGPLNKAHTEELIKRRLDIPGDKSETFPEFVDFLYDISNGNPLFIHEYLDLLQEEDLVDPSKDRYPTDERELGVSPLLEEVLKRKIERLSKRAKKVLQRASVIGYEFSFEKLRSISTLDEFELLDEIDILTDEGMLEEKEEGERLVFSHRPLHLVTYDDLSNVLKRKFHEKVGECIEEMHEDDLEGVHSELGFHFERAERYGKSIRYYFLAGKHAQESFANREAISTYEKVLEMIEEHGKPDKVSEDKVLERLGDSHMTVGEFDRARKVYQELEPKHEKMGLIKQAKLSMTHLKQGDFGESIERAEHGLEQATVDLDQELEDEIAGKIIYHEEVCMLLLLKGWGFVRTGRLKEGEKIFEKEKLIAEDSDNETILADALHNLGAVKYHLGDLEDAERLLQRAVKLREKTSDKDRLSRTLGNLSLVHKQKGKVKKAAECLKRSGELAYEVGDLGGIATNKLNLGGLRKLQGKLERAEECYKESKDKFEAMGDETGVASALNSLGHLKRMKVELEKARELYEKGLELSKENDYTKGSTIALIELGKISFLTGEEKRWEDIHDRLLSVSEEIENKKLAMGIYLALGKIDLLDGSIDRSQTHYRKVFERSKEIGDQAKVIKSLLGIGRTQLEEGNLKEAKKTVERIDIVLDEGGSMTDYHEGEYLRLKGLLKIKRGEIEKGLELYERAKEEFDDLGKRLEIVKMDMLFGRYLVEEDEEKEGKKLLKEAREKCEERGIEIWEEINSQT